MIEYNSLVPRLHSAFHCYMRKLGGAWGRDYEYISTAAMEIWREVPLWTICYDIVDTVLRKYM